MSFINRYFNFFRPDSIAKIILDQELKSHGYNLDDVSMIKVNTQEFSLFQYGGPDEPYAILMDFLVANRQGKAFSFYEFFNVKQKSFTVRDFAKAASLPILTTMQPCNAIIKSEVNILINPRDFIILNSIHSQASARIKNMFTHEIWNVSEGADAIIAACSDLDETIPKIVFENPVPV